MNKKLFYVFDWINTRLPIQKIWNNYIAKYYLPKNLNFWYIFGSLSLFVLVNQIVTGIWLTMYYTPTQAEAFNSIQHIMRNVNFGWLIRYMHTTGASAFFIVIYLHMYRALMYGSYKKPREVLWLIGMLLYVLLVDEAFSGYVLPWGQMSYWAAQVMESLIKAIPLVGVKLAIWLMGDYSVTGVTLHRYFALHVTIIPMLIVLLVLLHLFALRSVGSNNPDGIELHKKINEHNRPSDTVPFHPYFTMKDLFGLAVFLIVFASVIFFSPGMHGYFIEHENYVPANPLVTPEHIRPAWYLSPFYAILRGIPDKTLGIVTMAAAIAILFILPWLDRSRVKSLRYKGIWSKVAIILFVVSFAGLGLLGTLPVNTITVWLARILTIIYFLFFILMPYYTRKEETKHVPAQVTNV